MRRLADLTFALFGLAGFALLLVLFLGAAVYRADPQGEAAAEEEGGILTLPYDLGYSQEQIKELPGGTCRVFIRQYQLSDGRMAEAVSADSPLYLQVLRDGEHLAGGRYTLCGMDAVLYTGGGDALLAAQGNGWAYLLRLIGEDEKNTALLTLATQARLEKEEPAP